jgi:hypothetical protein
VFLDSRNYLPIIILGVEGLKMGVTGFTSGTYISNMNAGGMFNSCCPEI